MASKNFSQRLKQARINAGFTQKEVYEHFGIPQSTFSSWEIGKSEPSGEMLIQLCEFYKCDLMKEFSDTAPGIMTISDIELVRKYHSLDSHGKDIVDTVLEKEYTRSVSIKEAAEPEVVVNLPYAYDLAASAGIGEYAMDIAHFKTVGLTEAPPRGADFLVRISGDSMEPKYSDGDKVYIKRQDAVNEGEIGLFYLDGNVYIKKQGYDELISLNSEYDPIPVAEYSYSKCFGKVLGKCNGDIIEL